MLEDTFNGMEDQDELEDEAQVEVEKILFEVTNGIHVYFLIFCFKKYLKFIIKVRKIDNSEMNNI